MISGLRMLPRVQAERQRRRDDGDPNADTYMDCTACKALPDYATSIAPEWRCGWLSDCEWRDGMAPHSEDVCPGYSISMPEVIEVAQAYGWREKGSLDALYEEMPLPPPVVHYVNVLGAEIAAVESETLRRIREEAKRGA